MGRCCLWRCRVALREEHFWWGCCLWWRCRREDAITPGLLELQHRYSFVGRRSAGQMQRCDGFGFTCFLPLCLAAVCSVVLFAAQPLHDASDAAIE